MLQLPPSPSELLKEFRNRPPGTLTPRPPDPIPEPFTKTKEKMTARQFCAIWLRAAVSVTFFQGYKQPIMKNCRVAGALAVAQLVTGVFLTAISFHISKLSTSLKVRDIPVWAGIPLAVTGLYGTLFISCCHKEYPGACGIFTMKALSFVMSVITALLCLCSVTFQSIHLKNMMVYTQCVQEYTPTFSESCICHVLSPPRIRLYPYSGMNCDDVFTVLRIFFVVTCITSCIGTIFTFWYTALLWGNRFEHFYAGLRRNEDDPLPCTKM